MNGSKLALKWAENFLKKYEIIGIKNEAKTDYSSVVKIECKNDTFFLKQNHPIFNYEDQLATYLDANHTNGLKVEARNKDLNCFITQNGGVQIGSKIVEHYESVANQWIEIQMKSNVMELKEMGFKPFFEREILELCGKYEINSKRILQCWNKIEESIPASLEHGDFHLGNILLGSNNRITFIDLAEGKITNPLFSLLSFENTLRWRGNVDEKIINHAKSYWINRYSEVIGIDSEVIELMYLRSKEIVPIYCIFGLDILLKTCSSETFRTKINFKILKYKKELYQSGF